MTPTPDTANQILLSGGGPTGALEESKARLYVLTRFDNAIKIINTQTKTEIGGVAMYNPEPAHVVSGRFLYDASFSSSHGDSACASCHIFGDMDHLGWNPATRTSPTSPIPTSMSTCPFPEEVFAHERRHDHPELTRHGQPGPHALARRSHGRRLGGPRHSPTPATSTSA